MEVDVQTPMQHLHVHQTRLPGWQLTLLHGFWTSSGRPSGASTTDHNDHKTAAYIFSVESGRSEMGFDCSPSERSITLSQ